MLTHRVTENSTYMYHLFCMLITPLFTPLPFLLMYGHYPLCTPFSKSNKFDSLSYSAHLQAKLAELRNFVEANLTEAAHYQKCTYDQAHFCIYAHFVLAIRFGSLFPLLENLNSSAGEIGGSKAHKYGNHKGQEHKSPMQSGSRSSPWWNGSTRTKPASKESLNISRSREGVFARENVASRV